MSGTSFDISSISSSDSDISVCEDIEQLIEQCVQLHEHINESYELLQNLSQMLETSDNITVICDGTLMNLSELLESLHTKALNDIKENGNSSFGLDLLNYL